MSIRNKAWKMILEQQFEMRNDHEAEVIPKVQRKLDDSDFNDRADSDDEMANKQTATKSTESLRPLTKSFVIRQTTMLNRHYSEQEEAKEDSYWYMTHKGIKLPQLHQKNRHQVVRGKTHSNLFKTNAVPKTKQQVDDDFFRISDRNRHPPVT